MFKKTLSLVTLVAFLLFDWACIIHNVNNEPASAVAGKDQIVGLTKISGESIQFPKENPARLVGDRIVQSASEINAIDKSDIKEFRQNDKGVVYEITTKNGRTIRNVEGKIEGEKIVVNLLKHELASIPLSAVKTVQIRRVNIVITILATMGIIYGVIGGFFGLAALANYNHKAF